MAAVPTPFLLRKLQSLAGLLLVIYLIFHLLTNSQAALWFGSDGKGFIQDVNFIHSLPYLLVIELLLFSIFLIHMIWGVQYLFTSKTNSWPSDGSVPSIEYGSNKAYTWQRITSWILLVAVVAHVVHMRIIKYPATVQLGEQEYYIQPVTEDPGLYTVANRLGVLVLNEKDIENKRMPPLAEIDEPNLPEDVVSTLAAQQEEQQKKWHSAINSFNIQESHAAIVAKNFGTATLFLLRDTFKNIWLAILYTIFVLAACYHAFNGLWAFLFKWGVTQNTKAMSGGRIFTNVLMGLTAFLGLSAIWITYWFNLKS